MLPHSSTPKNESSRRPRSNFIRWPELSQLLTTLIVLGTGELSPATEPVRLLEADSPITSGLIANFDAISPGPGEKTADAESKSPLSTWTSSGAAKLQCVAANKDSAPQRVQVGDAWIVRFDGEDDALRTTKSGLALSSATIFVVAAPHSNLGDFRGLLAANAPDQRDYQSGFNIDLGPGPTFAFEQLNIEGKGFGGAANLRQQPSPMGQLRVLETTIDAAASKVRLKVDGKSEGSREYNPQTMSLEELTIGARAILDAQSHSISR